jgi:hypothetical protein
MPFFIIELVVLARSHFTTGPFESNWHLERFGPETHSQGGGWLSDQAKSYWTRHHETRCRLQLAFLSVTQAFDAVMGSFDLRELTGNKLLSCWRQAVLQSFLVFFYC